MRKSLLAVLLFVTSFVWADDMWRTDREPQWVINKERRDQYSEIIITQREILNSPDTRQQAVSLAREHNNDYYIRMWLLVGGASNKQQLQRLINRGYEVIAWRECYVEGTSISAVITLQSIIGAPGPDSRYIIRYYERD